MIFKNEKQLLLIIKYAPPLFVLTISLIILLFSYFENINTFKAEKKRIQTEHISYNKHLIKEEVENIYNYVNKEYALTQEYLKESLHQSLENAYKIANSIYINNQDKSKEELKELIVDALRNIRFNNGRGYFFIYEKNGKNIMLPPSPELEGKDFWNHQDKKGTYIIQDMIKLLSNKDEVFYQWYWYKPNDSSEQKRKIGLVKNFKPFNWFIGTGEYIEDYEKEVQEKVLSYIREHRYGKNGYIFVINYDSIYLSHIRKNFIGRNAVTNNDTVGIKKVIEDLIKISKNGDGYYSYIQNKKPDTNLPVKKLSYVKGFNQWSWMIGTGFYEDDVKLIIEKRKKELDIRFNKYIKNIITISAILIIILLLFSIYFSKKIRDKFEEYKKETSAHLEFKVKQQNLIAQESKIIAMGEMIGNIAHQWRQPLSAITTSATGIKLQMELGIISDDAIVDGLNSINSSAQSLSTTIDDFRNFFNPHKEKVFFKLSKAIIKAKELVINQFINQNIEFIEDIEDLEIENLENDFIQVFINLLSNAKEELIKKDDIQRYIIIKVRRINNKAVIEIIDNAGGIKDEIKDRIFEPYFTTKHKSVGTGIGLFMCREIISKYMDGEIVAENIDFEYDNIKYKGAKFSIILPI